jgi:hypothetical protein
VSVKSCQKEIIIYSEGNKVCRHRRRGGFLDASVDIMHYLGTLGKKPGALKNSAALRNCEPLIEEAANTGMPHGEFLDGLLECEPECRKENRLKNRKKFEKFELVILDELGCVSFDKDGNEMLFNLLSARNDAGSIIVTTNLVFERWVEVFKDPVLTGALVDRLAHRSYVLDMSGDSCRIKETMKWLENTMGKFDGTGTGNAEKKEEKQ